MLVQLITGTEGTNVCSSFLASPATQCPSAPACSPDPATITELPQEKMPAAISM